MCTLTASDRDLLLVGPTVARSSLIAFTAYVFPTYIVNWHHQLVAGALDRVLSGKCRRLMICMPPQNGKSELVSRHFPAYAFGKRPDVRLITVSYGDSLAQDMSRDVQKIMSSTHYREVFPKTRLATSRDVEKRTQGQFEIVGHKGYYIASGIMGALTGKTADIGIIDDPIKNREEAESPVYRAKVFEQYKTAFATRQFGYTGSIVLCMTRWHEDDLAGKLLQLSKDNPDGDQWEVVSLPAIAEAPDAYRQIGEPLWPAKYPLDELQRRRIGMGEYDWSALYQQQPAPEGGGLFKREWFKFVDAVPSFARRVRGWDTASGEGRGDWTVGAKIAEANKLFFVENIRRGQWSPATVETIMRQTAVLDGYTCAQREEREGGSAGKAVTDARAKQLVGFDYAAVNISGSKVTRVRAFRAQCEAGNVYLVRGDWNEEYISELCKFPTGKHDDQVDASSCAFNAVLLEPSPVFASPTAVGGGRSYWNGPR